MRRQRRSFAGRAIGIDAEPYRGRLVEDRGPRVGIVGHGGGRFDRHRVRNSLMTRRQSQIDGRASTHGRRGSPEWERASASQAYRRGFVAGVVVAGSACGVLMLVGFFAMGGSDRLVQRLAPTRATTALEARDHTTGPQSNAAGPDARGSEAAPHDGITAQEADLNDLAHEDLEGRDYGFEELARTHEHNRKVLQRGSKLLNALSGKAE